MRLASRFTNRATTNGGSCKRKKNLPTTEKVNEPDPDWQRWEEELASGRHAEKPGSAHEGKQLQGRGRGGDPERKERQANEQGVLQVGESPVMLLQVSQAVPEVEGRLQARDVLAAMRRVGLCPGASASVAGGKTVEERQVDVLGEERRQLGLSRSKIHRNFVFFFLFLQSVPKKKMFKKMKAKKLVAVEMRCEEVVVILCSKKSNGCGDKKGVDARRLESGKV